MRRPFPGIEAEVVDEKGNKVGPGQGGYLAAPKQLNATGKAATDNPIAIAR